MKFFFGIVVVALVALASAEQPAKEITPEALPVAESESVDRVRNRRGLLYSAPVVAAPVAAAPIVAAPVAYATPVARSYSALVRYPYAGYSAYAPYVPAVYL